MRAVATVARAYGYYLGNPDGWDVAEAGHFGELNQYWYSDDGPRGTCSRFIHSAMEQLKTQGAPDGVAFHLYGRLVPGSVEMYVFLAAAGSYSSTENWGDSLSVTAEILLLPELPDWDDQLAAALGVLELTPHQEHASWQFLPSLHR